jgi:hypothetical protein
LSGKPTHADHTRGAKVDKRVTYQAIKAREGIKGQSGSCYDTLSSASGCSPCVLHCTEVSHNVEEEGEDLLLKRNVGRIRGIWGGDADISPRVRLNVTNRVQVAEADCDVALDGAAEQGEERRGGGGRCINHEAEGEPQDEIRGGVDAEVEGRDRLARGGGQGMQCSCEDHRYKRQQSRR